MNTSSHSSSHGLASCCTDSLQGSCAPFAVQLASMGAAEISLHLHVGILSA